ncbi:MAG: phage head morphosis protein, partial [Acidobacteria bacterium]|nr:phage head morphosis protein [Acidobacteriota bacterium]
MTPKLTPTLKPFQPAIDVHLQRVPMTSTAMAELSDEARARAFWVSGLSRQATVTEAYRLGEEAIAGNLTKAEFRNSFAAYLAANDGTVLSDSRIDLIYRQALITARTTGRYRQLTDPDVLAARPFWMYPLGPSDERTTEVCRSLQGFIAPANSEVWNHIYPPNHYRERHNQIVSLSAAQAEATGRVYVGPPEDQYPFVGGQRILPDPGFDHAPGLLASDGAALEAQVAELGEEVATKTAADYALPDLVHIPGSAMEPAPELAAELAPH